jgi:hypothetical protein
MHRMFARALLAAGLLALSAAPSFAQMPQPGTSATGPAIAPSAAPPPVSTDPPPVPASRAPVAVPEVVAPSAERKSGTLGAAPTHSSTSQTAPSR